MTYRPLALIVLFLTVAFSLRAQQPEQPIWPNQLAAAGTGRGACNAAGTTVQNLSSGSQSNDQLFLCFGDSLLINHQGDQDLSGDPDPATTPGIGYAFYSCPPTIGGMDLATIITDPCILATPPSPQGIWINTGTNPNGNNTFVNDGGLQDFFNGGAPVEIWFAPITVDDFFTNGYEEATPGSGAGPCVDVNINDAFSVVYLNRLTYANLQISAPGILPEGGSFTIIGGLPEFDGSTYTVNIYRKSNPAQTALITSGPATHGSVVTFEVPTAGVYVVELSDGKTCGETFEIKIPGVTLDIPCVDVVEGGTVCLDINITNYEDIESFQFLFHFDPNLLQFSQIDSVNLQSWDPVFASVQNDSILFMGYFAFPGESIPDGGLFARICFTAIGPPNTCSPITMAPNPVGPVTLQCYNGDGVNLGVNFNEGCICILPGGPVSLNLAADSVSCDGATDGSLTVDVSGGTEPFTYEWAHATNPAYQGNGTIFFNPGSVTLPNLIGGNYSVTITDSAVPPNQEIKAINVPEPAPILINLDAITPTCSGDMDGSILAAVTGGTTPYDFAWSTGAQGPGEVSVTGLGNGNYSLTITDINGCSAVETQTVQTDTLVVELVNVTDETCLNGGNDGSITVAATGGTINPGSTYSYDWGGAGNGAFLPGLSAASYTVTVTDDNGCFDTLTVEVNAPASPSIDSLIVTDAGCPDKANGAITALTTAAPGAPNLTFSWTGPNATTFTGSTITGLVSGNYFVTVVDDNGCSDVAVTFVDSPFPLTIVDTLRNRPDCPGGTNGSLGLQVVGGTQPYSFTWENVGTPSPNSVNFPIGAGTYTVTVTDAEGCGPLTLELTLDDPPAIEGFFSLIDSVSCEQGVCDGTATATAGYTDGTTGTFTFNWSSGEFDVNVPSSTALALCGGTQGVTIADGICAIDTFVVIPSPEPIVVDPIATDIRCFGEVNGMITINVSGGSPGYQYVWAAGDTSLVNERTDLGTGFYQISVVDQKGCLGTGPVVEIQEPNPFSVLLDTDNTFDVRCAGEFNGQIAVETMGGNPGAATYLWSPAVSTSELATGLGVGTYAITATDPRGCLDTISVTLSAPPAIVATIPPIAEPLCNGESTILTVASASGGNGPSFTFSVDNSLPEDLNTPVSVFADQPILVRVFDSQGCFWDTTVIVNQPLPLTLDLGPDQELELGDSVQLQPLNDLSSFTLSTSFWSPPSGLSCPSCLVTFAKPDQTTTYSLMIEDINGCFAEDEITVQVETIRRVYVPTAFSPNFDGFNDELSIYTGRGVALIDQFDIFDRWGNQVFRRQGIPPSSDGTILGWDGTYKGRIMDPGVYVYAIQVTFIDGQQLTYRGEINLVR